jgi:hypothetical protein
MVIFSHWGIVAAAVSYVSFCRFPSEHLSISHLESAVCPAEAASRNHNTAAIQPKKLMRDQKESLKATKLFAPSATQVRQKTFLIK